MESALNIFTGEIVDAARLQSLPEPEKGRYVCHGCGVRLLPASYRPSNLVSPYFTVGCSGAHLESCDVVGASKMSPCDAEKRSGSVRDGIPALFPTRLLLKTSVKSSVETDMPARCATPEFGVPSRSSLPQPSGGLLRSRAVNTIRQICRTFVDYPDDRDLVLHIPGVKATKYCTVFKKLKWDELQHYPGLRIFYAALRWTKLVEDDVCLELALDAGLREGGRLVAGHCLKIVWEAWSDARKAVVRRELLDAQLCARHAFRAGSRGVKAYVFFLGSQDVTDLRVFRVDDYRLLCCLVEQISYPKF